MEGETRERDELDDVIDRCRMIERTGLSRDDLHRRVRKATMCLNLANCLADVMETLVMDAESILRPFGATFEREDKLRFKQLTKALEDVQKCTKRTTLGLYTHKDADDFAEDCDWWYNMVRLLADRTGDDELKTLQVINWLTTMPTQLSMFDVKKRDFKRIRL
jgi:hypothetical protein